MREIVLSAEIVEAGSVGDSDGAVLHHEDDEGFMHVIDMQLPRYCVIELAKELYGQVEIVIRTPNVEKTTLKDSNDG